MANNIGGQQMAVQQQQPPQTVHEFRLYSSGKSVLLYKDGELVGNAMQGYENILLKNQGVTPSDVVYKDYTLIQKGAGVEAAERGKAQTQAKIKSAQAEQRAHEEEQKLLRGGFMGRAAQARLSGVPSSEQPQTFEQFKRAELQAAQEKAEFGQRLRGTTPQEAQAIGKMLKSEGAGFAPGAGQIGFNIASYYDRTFQPSEVKAHEVAPPQKTEYPGTPSPQDLFKYTPQKPPDLAQFKGKLTPQRGSLAEEYYRQKEKEKAISWYDRLSAPEKAIAVIGAGSFGVYGSILESKLGRDFDPTAGIPRVESVTMGKQTYTFKEQPKPTPSEAYKLQLYQHYKPEEISKMSLYDRLKTGLYKGVTSDVVLTGASAYGLGAGIGLIGRLPGLKIVPSLAGKIAIGYTAADVGLKVATKQYAGAALEAGVFLAYTPAAIAGYRAGMKVPIPGKVGLLEQAKYIINIKEYNKYVAEAGTSKKFGTFQPESDISKYNLMVGEAVFKIKPVKDVFPISRFAKGREGGFIERRGTVESHNILTAEQPIAFKKMSLHESIKTGFRLQKPFSKSELLFTKGKTIEEYNLMVREPQFKKLELKTSIEEYNKMVGERTLPSKIKVPVSVLDILMVSGSGRVRPGQRLITPSKALERSYFKKLSSKRGYELTARRSIGARDLMFVPYIDLATRREKITSIKSEVAQRSKDLSKSKQAFKALDITGTSFASIQGMGMTQLQEQEQSQAQRQEQTQKQQQLQRQVQTQVSRQFERQREKTPKPPRIKEPKIPRIPDTLSPLFKKKKKKGKKGRIFPEISPTMTIPEIMKGTISKQKLPKKSSIWSNKQRIL